MAEGVPAVAELAITRKVGEGYDRPQGDQHLPVDINYQKLVDWLVSRGCLGRPNLP